MTNGNGSRVIESVQKTCAVIRVIEQSGSIGVTGIANELNLSKGTVHGHLSTLRENNYVAKHGGEYHLGLRFFELGNRIKEELGFLDVVEQELKELSSTTGELAQFAIEEEGQAVYLSKVTHDRAIEGTSRPGKREYMHTIALGKAMLSQMPKQRVDEIIDRYGLPGSTENTITEPDELESELELIRERGFAIDNEEKREGLNCVAAPVGIGDDILGAVSISGPAERFTGKYSQKELPEEVIRAANIIEVHCIDTVRYE